MNELTLMKKSLQSRPKNLQIYIYIQKVRKLVQVNVISCDFAFRKLFKAKIEL